MEKNHFTVQQKHLSTFKISYIYKTTAFSKNKKTWKPCFKHYVFGKYIQKLLMQYWCSNVINM